MLGFSTLATVPLAVGPLTSVQDSGGLFAFSDRAYATRPTDVPPNLGYEPRVLVPLVVDRQAPLLPGSGNRAALSIGEITFANTDGFFDHLLDTYAIDGRRVKVKVGTPDLAYSEFQDLYSGTALQWSESTETEVRLALRDMLWRAALPIQPSLYLGTGGVEGGADIKDKPKPLCYGIAFNVSPTLIDAGRLIYQVHSGAIVGVNAIYSNGAPAQAAGDVAGNIFSDTLHVNPGFYVTDTSRGLFRLGDTFGQITADITGEVLAGSSTASIARYILTQTLTTSELDLDSFDLLDSINSAQIGLYVSSEERPTTLEIIDELINGVSGWWGAGRLGKVQVGLITGPSEFATFSLDETNIINIEKLQAEAPPAYRWRVGYQRNWTVMSEASLATVLAADRKQFFSSQYRVAGAFDQSIAIKHVLASDPPLISGLFAWQQDADAEAKRLLDLWGTDRHLYRITSKIPFLLADHAALDIGLTGYVTYPRFGLDEGEVVQIVGVRLDADRNEVTLTVLGGFPPPVFIPTTLPPGTTGAVIRVYIATGGAFAGITGAATASSFSAKTRVYVGKVGAFSAGSATTTFIPRIGIRIFTALISGGGVSSGAGITAKVATAWVPSTTNLPGLQGWFHPGSAKTIVSGAISQWNDASGLGNHLTQATAALRPLHEVGSFAANASVKFTNTQYLQGNAVATNPANMGTGDDTPSSIAMVVAIDDVTTYGQMLTAWRSTGTARIYSAFSAGTTLTYTAQRRDDAGTLAYGNSFFQPGPAQSTFYFLEQIFDGVTHSTYVNGTLYGVRDLSAVGTMSAFDRFVVGVDDTLAGGFFTGRIVELLVGARNAWNTTQRINLETYIGSKYQITMGAGPSWVLPVANDDTIDTAGVAYIGSPYYIDPATLIGNDTADGRATLEVYSVGDGVTVGGAVALLTDATTGDVLIQFTPSATGTCSFQYNIRDTRNFTSFARCNLLNVGSTADLSLSENFENGTTVSTAADTRSGTATYIDTNGQIQVAAANTQRFDGS